MAQYLDKNHTKQMIEELEHILGDTFMVYTKTHAYHWNVEGAQFHALHVLFEEQYTDMWKALDEIAERIRSLGVYAPVNFSEIMKASDIKESKNVPKAMDMVKELASDNEKLSKHLAKAIEKASEVGDEGTADMLVARQKIHDQNAWMLNATAS